MGGVCCIKWSTAGGSEGATLNGTGSTKWHLVGASSPHLVWASSPLSGTLWGRVAH